LYENSARQLDFELAFSVKYPLFISIFREVRCVVALSPGFFHPFEMQLTAYFAPLPLQLKKGIIVSVSNFKTLEAFGQTWHITPAALSALRKAGIFSDAKLKALVINVTSAKGLAEGEHRVEYFGVELRLSVERGLVIVGVN
jgi:hypothetical protein